MPPGPVYIASDVHLGAVPPDVENGFLEWLDHAGSRASTVVLNGDLFDFWFEYRHAIPRGHTRVLGALAAIADAGVPVHLVGGNHDWWGGSFLEDEVGLVFHRDPLVLDLAGRRTFLAHGDGIGRGDLGYRLLRALLRGRLTRWGFRWLHPDVGAGVARLVSGTGEWDEARVRRNEERARALEEWSVAKLEAEKELDLVVLGHTHTPRLREVGHDRWYVNSGDWVRHRSFVVLEEGRPPLVSEWEGTPR